MRYAVEWYSEYFSNWLGSVHTYPSKEEAQQCIKDARTIFPLCLYRIKEIEDETGGY